MGYIENNLTTLSLQGSVGSIKNHLTPALEYVNYLGIFKWSKKLILFLTSFL